MALGGGASAAPEVDTTGLQLVESRAVAVGDALHLQREQRGSGRGRGGGSSRRGRTECV